MLKDFRKFFKLPVFTGIVGIFLLVSLVFWPLELNLKQQYRVMQTIPLSSELVVLGIDDATLNSFGSWPWNRQVLAEIIEKILDSGAGKLGLDLLLQNSEELKNEQLTKLISDDRVITAYFDGVKHLTSSQLLGQNTGSVALPIAPDGLVYSVNSTVNEAPIFAAKLAGKENIPKQFLVNPQTSLPPVLSLVDVLNSEWLLQSLSGKTVILGSTSQTLNDFFQIPKLGRISGPVLHALIANQILQNNFPQLHLNQQLLIFLVVVTLAILLSVRRLSEYENWLWLQLFLVLILVWFLPAIKIIGIGYYLTLLVTVFTSFGLVKIINNWGDRLQLRKILGAHLSPNLMRELMKHLPEINLGGQKFNMTFLFSDLRGFTKYSEKTDPALVGQTLNRILGAQADIILANEGVVDKFVGDAVMGFWGAPVTDENHAYRALLAACQIVLKMDHMNRKLGTNFEIGLGLHSGDAVVGNFGSPQRFSYTAIGDTVNTASRIEAMTKSYESKLLVSKQVINLLKEGQKKEFQFKLIDVVQPRGKSTKIHLYQVQKFNYLGNWKVINS